MTHGKHPYRLIHRVLSFDQHHTSFSKQAFTGHLETIAMTVSHLRRITPCITSALIDGLTASSISSTTNPSPSSKHSSPSGFLESIPNSKNSWPWRPNRLRVDVNCSASRSAISDHVVQEHYRRKLTFRYSPRSCPPMTGGVKFSLRKTSYMRYAPR